MTEENIKKLEEAINAWSNKDEETIKKIKKSIYKWKNDEIKVKK